ncbi:MAG: preprotein translocase subunit SecA, partial [Eggerthellaceae bacterium]|nr:preprotein translocase subunit SecA [Eggerthellaceae bacterium]
REGAVTISTNMAGRGTDILLGGNRRMLKEDHLASLVRWNNGETFDWMEESAEDHARYVTDREGYSTRVLGGLFVIGAARFEARRIDNQLRGRAGRQGDPGETRFYLSLEDELLVAFGGDRLKAVSDMMEKRGLGDDAPIEDVAVSKVITAAQKEMESAHFNQRKFLLDFDDVMNRQRLSIYKERNAILEGEKDVTALLREVARDNAYSAVALCCPASDPSDDWNMRALEGWWFSMAGTSPLELPGPGGEPFSIRDVEHGEDPDALAAELADALERALAAKRDALGEDAFEGIARRSLLEVLDRKWVLHQQDMDRLRQGIMLRAVGRREPLLEFKEESYGAFGELVASVYEDWLGILLHLATPKADADEKPAAAISFGAPAEVTANQGDSETPADFSPITDNPLG